MLIPNFKYIYADTNVVSNICKENGIVLDFLRHFPPGENYLLCFSTYTLYEISKNDVLMNQFQKLYALFPCAIMVSYFPLGLKEVEMIAGNTNEVDPVLLTPQGILHEGKKIHPDSLSTLLSSSEVLDAFKNIEQKSEELFLEYSTLLDKEEFSKLKGQNYSRNQFIDTFKNYELKHRFFGGQWKNLDKTKINKMKSLDVLAQAIYYKFYSDTFRKFSQSDIIDVLIMTTAPYVHTFISEKNCIDIYRKIINMNKCSISNHFMTISELKK
jgi:hypothetical protein